VSGNKHPKLKPGTELPGSDLKVNPGIGASKGAFATGEDPRQLEGGNTVEGDVGNDTNPQGGIDPGKLGRTNK
jgi:hypothetical protein